MTKQAVIAVSALLALSSVGCGRREEPSQVSREPLAKAAPVLAAAPPAPAAPAAPATAAPATLPVKSDKALAAPEPAKKLAKAVPDAVVASGLGLAVRRLVVTRSIDHREPAAADRLTASDEPLFAFVELENKADAAAGVVISFEHEGKSVGHIKLEVPAKSSRWRTWGKTRQVRQSGEWVAVVETPDGKELARKSFTID